MSYAELRQCAARYNALNHSHKTRRRMKMTFLSSRCDTHKYNTVIKTGDSGGLSGNFIYLCCAEAFARLVRINGGSGEH